MVAHGLILHLLIFALSGLMLWVIVSDAVRYTIPNLLNGAILVLYGAALLLLPGLDPLMALVAAALMLAVGLGLFALGLMGGGDIKLLVVLTLWTGWGMATLQLLFLTAVFGGVLVLLLLALRVVVPPLWLRLRPTHTLPRVLGRKQPVPYGIAIAVAFAWMLWTGSIAGLR